MPEIPQYFKRAKLQDRIYRGPAYSPVAERATGEAGSVLTQFGLNVLEQFKKTEATDQFNNFQAQTIDAVNQYMRGLDPTGDTGAWEQGLDDLLVKRRSEALPGLSNTEARHSAEAWLTGREVEWKNKVFWSAREAKTDQMAANMEKNVGFYMRGAIEAPDDSAFDENMALLHDEIYSRTTIDAEGDINLLSKEEADLKWQQLQEKIEEEREKFVKVADEKAERQREDEHFEYLTNPDMELTEEEAIAAASKLKYEDIGDRREELIVRLRNHFALQEFQEKKVIEDFKKDFGERLDTATPDKLGDMLEEARANDTISSADQEALVKDVRDRIKYLQEGSDIVTDPIALAEYQDQAVFLDPNSKEYTEFITTVRRDDRLHPKDRATVTKLARDTYQEAQQASLSLGLKGAQSLIRPLELMSREEWVAKRSAEGKPTDTDEAKDEFIKFIADQSLQAHRQELEENLSRYAQQAMRQYLLSHREAKPIELDQQFEFIRRQFRQIRDAGIDRMEGELAQREGLLEEDKSEARIKAMIENYRSRSGSTLTQDEVKQVIEEIKKPSRRVYGANAYGVQPVKPPSAETPKVDYVMQLDQWMKTQSNMDSLPEDLVTDLQSALRAVGKGADPKLVFQDILKVYRNENYLKTKTREEQVSLRQFYAQIIEPITKDASR